jgi:hypothetical protein
MIEKPGMKEMFDAKFPISRRLFFQLLGRTAGVSAVGLLGGGIYARMVEPTWLEVNRYKVPLPKLPSVFSGMRIAQLSDLHHSELLEKEYLEKVMLCVMEEKPDLIAITGDFITGYHGDVGAYHRTVGDRYLAAVCEMLKTLRAPLGVWASFGNHDFWFGHKMVAAYLAERCGIRVLRDENVPIERRGQRFFLVGITDLWSEPIQWKKALRGTSSGDCTIAMMHNPDGFVEAQRHGLDFVMCGHTHGGQVRIPFFGPPVLPIEDRRLAQGWFREGPTRMYVNKGIGVIGFPVRFNVRPEAAIFELLSI